MKVYLDSNYPKNLAEALQLLHKLQNPQQFEIIRTQHLGENDVSDSVVFLFDRSKRGVDIVTEKHYEAGYKVIAFKLASADKIDFFQLSLVTMKLWPNILSILGQTNDPFIFTYNYNGKALVKVKSKE